jgi:hypothetical protein
VISQNPNDVVVPEDRPLTVSIMGDRAGCAHLVVHRDLVCEDIG